MSRNQPEMGELLPTSFTDSHGEQWTIPHDVNSIVRVARETGIKLTDLVSRDSESARRWIEEFPVINVTVLYSLLAEQARERGIEPEEIGRRLADEDAFNDALRCINNAIVNFSPRPRRQWLKRALPQAEAAFDRMRETEANLADLAEVDWDKIMSDLLTPSDSATDSPESVESTPAPAH